MSGREWHAHPKHLLGPRFRSKHGQDPGATPDVQHHLIFENVLVVVHGVPVSERPHLVLQHFLCGKKGKSMARYSRHLAVHQGHGPQNCATKFFNELDEVARQATEEHHGAGRPAATGIITNIARPKTLRKRDRIVLAKEKLISRPGKAPIYHNQKKAPVQCSMRDSSYTCGKTLPW